MNHREQIELMTEALKAGGLDAAYEHLHRAMQDLAQIGELIRNEKRRTEAA